MSIQTCKRCGGKVHPTMIARMSGGEYCVCVTPKTRAFAPPEIRSGEWVEELEAALNHAANALDKWPDDDRTIESANYSQAMIVANDLRKLVNTERSRSPTEPR